MTTVSPVRHAYAAILEYLDQAETHLAGHTERRPDANLFCREQALPEGTILRACLGEDRDGPFIAAKIEHADEDRNPRFFDPSDMPPIFLLEIAGMLLRWHRTVQKKKVYLRLMLTASDQSASEGIPLARAIANSPPGMATSFERGHYDLRRPALTFVSAARRPYPPKFGRDDAVRIAFELYDKSGMADVLGVTSDAFKAQLERAYTVADNMHASRYSEEAD